MKKLKQVPTNETAQTVLEKLSQAESKYLLSRKISKQKKTAIAVAKIWEDTMKEFFPQGMRLGWTGKQLGQVKHFMKRAEKDFDYGDFFQRIIQNWDTIISANFGWVEGAKPTTPDIGFILAHLNRFWDAYEGLTKTGRVPRPYRDKAPQRDSSEATATDKKLIATLTDMLNRKDAEISTLKREISRLNAGNKKA